MSANSEPLLTRPQLIVAVCVLAGASFWVITRPDERGLRNDTIPDSGSTAAMLPRDATMLVDSAVGLRAKGQWDSAYAQLHQAVSQDPANARAALELARTLRYMRRYGETIVAANNALALAPGSMDALVERMSISVALGEPDKARVILDSAKLSDSLQHVLEAGLGQAQLSWLLNEATQRRLLNATVLSGRDDRATWCLSKADLYSWWGDEKRAKMWGDSARATPGIDDVRLALALAHSGLKDSAVAVAERALASARNVFDALAEARAEVNLARVLAIVGESNRALDMLSGMSRGRNEVSAGRIRTSPEWLKLRANRRFLAFTAAPL